jgi:hypothetical protein
MYRNYLFTCLLLLMGSGLAYAQTATTPYSSQGLGNIAGPALMHNAGMGGIGLANGNGLHINNINPALLYQNSLSGFDAGFQVEYKDMAKSGARASGWGGSFAYGVFAFPIINNRWTTSIGIAPYSNVSYNITETRNIDNKNEIANLTQEGSGGLSRVNFSHGVRLFKGLAVGLKTSYLFGAINEELKVLPLTGDDLNLITSYTDNIYYRGLLIEPALHYSLKTGESTSLNLGMVYQPQTTLSASRSVNFENNDPNGQVISNDTIIFDQQGTAVLPQKLGIGIALDKYLAYTVGVDFTMQQWSDFGAFQESESTAGRSNDGLQNGYTLAIGGQIIPDVTSISSYLKRITYRAGFRYNLTPFHVNDTQIRDLGVNVGFTLPMNNFSSMNLALEAGVRGTTDNDLIRENYFKAALGISFNDRWFVRRKFD